jgi:protein O-mannosyl-transferase
MSRDRKSRRSEAKAPVPSTASLVSQWAPLIAAAVAVIVYAPSIWGGFVYDDGQTILRNPLIRDLGDWRAIFRYEPARPLLTLTWALNYALGGEAAWHYHLVNVLIHAGNAALLASLFQWMAERLHRPDARLVALLGACLFAANPMAAETVAYVSSRSSALVTLFCLASLRVTASVLTGAPRLRLLAGIALWLLGLAIKEEAAALPIVLLLVDYFFLAEQRAAELRRRVWIHASFLVLLPLGLLARFVVTGSWLPPQATQPGLYLLTQWAAFPVYFLRALIPFDPALFRQHPQATWPPDLLTAAWSLLTLVLGLVAWKRRRDQPEWSFAIACLAAGLLPSSSIVALNEMVVDHRAYFGSFGVVFALTLWLWKLGRMRLVLLAVALCAGRSLAAEWVIGDPVRAWEDAVRRAPQSPVALCALGESYAAEGDARAEAAFLAATRLDPGVSRYWANLGLYYSEHGRPADAVVALRNAVDKAPQDAAIRDYLGQVLVAVGNQAEAEAQFQAALTAEPTFAQAYLDLALLALRQEQPDRARALLQRAAPLASDAEEAGKIAALLRSIP